ncbi:MAG: cation-efflux pump [Actinomycetota bacterium]|nr:cation-efflux pump [Actinomycetota bacterium]
MPRTAERTAAIALTVTLVLAAAKVAVWGATGSLAVLSQALDSVLDVVALALVFFAIRVAGRPADATHHYGHAKAENLIAFAETLVLGGLALWVAVEACLELAGTSQAEGPWYALILFGASIVIDGARARAMMRAARSETSAALHAGALNLLIDVATSGVALVSLLLIRQGVSKADAIGALIVAAAVLVATTRTAMRSIDVLMDRAPGAPAEAIQAAAARAPGVAEARRVRVRSGGRQKLFADVTVTAGRTASLERAHDIAESVESEIHAAIPNADVVVHVEPSNSDSGLVERVQAAASRVDGIQEVHNVLVHALNERGAPSLHATLHAKVDPGISVAEAHGLSEAVEDAVRTELGDSTRVDTHLEPMEPTAFGKDVTAARDDVVDLVRGLARDEPDILDCHEVVVTSSGDDLSVVAHVRGRDNLPLARIHDASERIENALRAQCPEVGPVLIHFEPA